MSTVLEIYISKVAESPMQAIDLAELEPGKGIVGDRYHSEAGTFSQKLAGLPDKELTLIESEKVDTFNTECNFSFTYGDFRRNIITEGVSLNELEGKEFTIGEVKLRGIRLCEPCAHLANLLVPEIMPVLVHKTGLRAQILNGGKIKVGDRLEVSTC